MRRFRLTMSLLALAWHGPAAADWRETTSDHFRIYADTSEAAIRTYAERLERFDSAMRSLRRVPREGSTANKLTIFALSNGSAVSALFGKGGSYVGGWYAPRTDGAIAFTPFGAHVGQSGAPILTPTIILLHEYTHHFLFRNSPGAYPAWFVEGYAEFCSTAKVDPDGAVVLGMSAAHRGRELFSDPMSAAELLADAKTLPLARRAAMYGKGWLLTHYLMFSTARTGQLDTYLTGIARGVPPAKAATDAFGDLTLLDAELRRYLMRRTIPAVRIAPERITIGPIAVRLLSPAEQAMMDIHIRSRRGVDPAQAKALVPRARLAAGPYPASAPAQTWLAEAELDAGNLAEAGAAADRAVAADPKDATALLFRARVAEVQAEGTAPAGRAAAWQEARRRIVAANRADPDAPSPLVHYYKSFVSAGLPPTTLAADGLYRAAQLAPEVMGLRFLIARQAIADRNPARARAALMPLAYAPHGGRGAETASRIIALIDRGADREVAAAIDQAIGGVEAEAGPAR